MIFGGDTLKDFAFALLIGIASGAYSSIFVAAPLLVLIKEREPEYARRKHEDVDGVAVRRRRPRRGRRRRRWQRPLVAPVPAPAPAPSVPSAGQERRRQRRTNRRPRPQQIGVCRRTPAGSRSRLRTASVMEEHMHEENGAGTAPRSLEQLLLAGIGWVSLGAEAVDELADELAKRVGVNRDEMRKAVRDTISSWRHESIVSATCAPRRRTGRCSVWGSSAARKLDDLALRIAQLEHRMRLLERPDAPPAA